MDSAAGFAAGEEWNSMSIQERVRVINESVNRQSHQPAPIDSKTSSVPSDEEYEESTESTTSFDGSNPGENEEIPLNCSKRGSVAELLRKMERQARGSQKSFANGAPIRGTSRPQLRQTERGASRSDHRYDKEDPRSVPENSGRVFHHVPHDISSSPSKDLDCSLRGRQGLSGVKSLVTMHHSPFMCKTGQKKEDKGLKAIDVGAQPDNPVTSPASTPGRQPRQSPSSVTSFFHDKSNKVSKPPVDICDGDSTPRRPFTIIERWKKGMVHVEDFSSSNESTPVRGCAKSGSVIQRYQSAIVQHAGSPKTQHAVVSNPSCHSETQTMSSVDPLLPPSSVETSRNDPKVDCPGQRSLESDRSPVCTPRSKRSWPPIVSTHCHSPSTIMVSAAEKHTASLGDAAGKAERGAENLINQVGVTSVASMTSSSDSRSNVSGYGEDNDGMMSPTCDEGNEYNKQRARPLGWKKSVPQTRPGIQPVDQSRCHGDVVGNGTATCSTCTEKAKKKGITEAWLERVSAKSDICLQAGSQTNSNTNGGACQGVGDDHHHHQHNNQVHNRGDHRSGLERCSEIKSNVEHDQQCPSPASSSGSRDLREYEVAERGEASLGGESPFRTMFTKQHEGHSLKLQNAEARDNGGSCSWPHAERSLGTRHVDDDDEYDLDYLSEGVLSSRSDLSAHIEAPNSRARGIALSHFHGGALIPPVIPLNGKEQFKEKSKNSTHDWCSPHPQPQRNPWSRTSKSGTRVVPDDCSSGKSTPEEHFRAITENSLILTSSNKTDTAVDGNHSTSSQDALLNETPKPCPNERNFDDLIEIEQKSVSLQNRLSNTSTKTERAAQPQLEIHETPFQRLKRKSKLRAQRQRDIYRKAIGKHSSNSPSTNNLNTTSSPATIGSNPVSNAAVTPDDSKKVGETTPAAEQPPRIDHPREQNAFAAKQTNQSLSTCTPTTRQMTSVASVSIRGGDANQKHANTESNSSIQEQSLRQKKCFTPPAVNLGSEAGQSDMARPFFSHTGSAFSGYSLYSNEQLSMIDSGKKDRQIAGAERLANAFACQSLFANPKAEAESIGSSADQSDQFQYLPPAISRRLSNEIGKKEQARLAGKYNTSSRFMDADFNSSGVLSADSSGINDSFSTDMTNSTSYSDTSTSFDSAASESQIYSGSITETFSTQRSILTSPRFEKHLDGDVSEAFCNAYQSLGVKKKREVSGPSIPFDLLSLKSGFNESVAAASESLRKIVGKPDKNKTIQSDGQPPYLGRHGASNEASDEGVAIEIEYLSGSEEESNNEQESQESETYVQDATSLKDGQKYHRTIMK